MVYILCRLKRLFVTFFIALLCGNLHAYKPEVHQEIGEKTTLTESNVLSNSVVLYDKLGIFYPVESDAQPLLPEDETIFGLIGQGSFNEDANWKYALNHFYDPWNDLRLNWNGFSGLNATSPDWILEDRMVYEGFPDNIAGEQKYSYGDAREFFYKALTTRNIDERKQHWRDTFLALGHVLHHIQDMTQPAHVRNDPHLDIVPRITFGGDGGELGVEDLDKRVWTPLYDESLYEIITKVWVNADSDDQQQGLPGDRMAYSGYPAFDTAKTPREFWVLDDQGIAEFTNANFFSEDTIDSNNYFGPFKYGPESLTTQQLCNEQPKLYCSDRVLALNGKIDMYSVDVNDIFTGEFITNNRAVSESIYNRDLVRKGFIGLRNQTMNKFNYYKAQTLLVPRAVGYGAGMINYFFRGTLEISLPDDGIYGIVDHAVENQKDVDGFRNIRLKVRNITETTDANGLPESTSPDGKWVAVAKFHTNTCYQPDLSGEFYLTGNEESAEISTLMIQHEESCRSKFEDIVVSNPVSLPAMNIDSPAELVNFVFEEAIPINAYDLYLQLVYQGDLGNEKDAVVVTTKDISEPTYVLWPNRVDQFFYGLVPDQTFEEFYCPDLTSEECLQYGAVTGYYRFAPPDNPDFNPSSAVAEDFEASLIFPLIPVGSYGRAAVLTDNEPLEIYILQEFFSTGAVVTVGYDSNTGEWAPATMPVIKNQYDYEFERMIEMVPYYDYRGILADYNNYVIWNIGDEGTKVHDGEWADLLPAYPLDAEIYF